MLSVSSRYRMPVVCSHINSNYKQHQSLWYNWWVGPNKMKRQKYVPFHPLYWGSEKEAQLQVGSESPKQGLLVNHCPIIECHTLHPMMLQQQCNMLITQQNFKNYFIVSLFSCCPPLQLFSSSVLTAAPPSSLHIKTKLSFYCPLNPHPNLLSILDGFPHNNYNQTLSAMPTISPTPYPKHIAIKP